VRTVFVLLAALTLLIAPQIGHTETETWYYRLALHGGGYLIASPGVASKEIPIGPMVGPEHTFLWEVAGHHEHLLGFSGAVTFGFFFTNDPGQLINTNLSLAYWYQTRGSEPGDGLYLRANIGFIDAFVTRKSDEEEKKNSFIWFPDIIFGPSLKFGMGWGWPTNETVRFTLGFNYELSVGIFGNVLNALYLDAGFLF
jgi:hypothetical protein